MQPNSLIKVQKRCKRSLWLRRWHRTAPGTSREQGSSGRDSQKQKAQLSSCPSHYPAQPASLQKSHLDATPIFASHFTCGGLWPWELPARWSFNLYLGVYTLAAWRVRWIKQVMASLKNSGQETPSEIQCKIAARNKKMDKGEVSGNLLAFSKELSEDFWLNTFTLKCPMDHSCVACLM